MNTIYKNIFILPLLFCSIFVFAQADSARINFIKGQFAEINSNLNSYKKVVKEDTAQTTEGNEVRCYFKGDTIKKIRAEYYGETFRSFEEYYFFSRKLIFYYGRFYRYDMPMYMKNFKIKSKKETRYYFFNGKIFLVKLNPEKTISSGKYSKLSVETQKEAERLLHLN